MSLNRLKNITLFQKNGEIIDLEYNEELDLLQGDLVFSKTSTGLIETQSLYFMEKVKIYDEIEYDDVRSFRHVKCKMHEGKFKFFDVGSPYESEPEIRVFDTFEEDFKEDKTATFRDDIVEIRDIFATPKCLQIMATSSEGGFIEDILVIELDGEIAIELTAQIFVEEEDERFIDRLADFGEYLSKDDAFLFRTHPTDGDVADVSILNRKRKEFLIEMHNIKPYFSSHKGVRGILNLFDFQDLKIKEYWLNPKTGKFVYEDLSEKSMDYSRLQKTSKFGLFFEYNSVVDDLYDDQGLPVVKDNFLFTVDEIVIKLFGIKKWIEDREIGGISDIVDIIGEFVFFGKYKITTSWSEHEHTQNVKSRSHIITTDRRVYYLQDTRNDSLYVADTDLQGNPKLSSIGSRKLSSIGSSIIGASIGYKGFHDTFVTGSSKSKIATEVTLRNDSFNRRYEDVPTNWENFKDVGATWGDVDHYQYYRATYELTDGDFQMTGEFSPSTSEIKILVNRKGVYDVKIVYEYYGGEEIFKKKKMFEVRQKIPNFLAFFKSHPSKVIHKHQRMSDARLRFLSSKIHEYERLHMLKDPSLGFRRMNYRKSEFKISDFGIRSWDDLNLSGVRYPSIIIHSFTQGRYSLQSKLFTLSGEMRERQTMRDLYEDIRHQIDLREFNVIYREWETSFIEIVSHRMVYEDIDLRAEGIRVEYKESVDYPFKWNNTNIYEQSFFVAPFHPIFFSVDESYIDGIVNANWKIKQGDTEVLNLTNSLVMCYTFQKIGNYTVECEIFDNAGNSSLCVKYNFVNVISGDDYDRYVKHVQ